MKLVIIRHGQAGNREEWEAKGHDDRLRPLTAEGKKEMRRASAGLARLVPSMDRLVTSPWVRAAQTAEIVAKEYGCKVETLDLLTADQKPDQLMPWLRELPSDARVGLVGHEPHLGLLVGYLLTGKNTSFVDLKKGGAGLLEIADEAKPGGGTLQWLLTDRELRRLG